MEVTNFNFKFKHEGETIPASCSVIKPQAHYQFRVVVEAEGKNGNVFMLYKVNQGDKKFFWYPLPGPKEAVAQSIARALTKEFIN